MKNDPVKKSPTQNINDVALAYMEQKYGERFEYVAPWGNSMSGTREFLAKCDSLPRQEVLVQIENYRNEDKIFRDNYLAVKYREDTIDFILNCANQVFGETTVFYDVAKMALSPELPVNATFDDYFADPRGFVSVSIEVKSSDFVSKEQAQKVIDPIATACKADYLGIIIVIVEDDKYGTFDIDSLGEHVVSRQFVQCVRLTRQNGSTFTEWLGEE